MGKPMFLRSVNIADMPDTDWAAAQSAPAVSDCFNTTGVSTIGVVYRAYTAAGAIVNPSGTMSLACIGIADTTATPGATSVTLIETTPLDTGVNAGDGLRYDVRSTTLITIRVAAEALAGTVDRVDIFITPID